MKKLKLFLLTFLFIFLPLSVDAKNALTLDGDKEAGPGEEVKFQLGIQLDSKYNDYITNISFDIIVDNNVVGNVSRASAEALNLWSINEKNNSYVLVSPKTENTGVSNGDHLFELTIPIKKDAPEGKTTIQIKPNSFVVRIKNPDPKPEDPIEAEAWEEYIAHTIDDVEGITRAINVKNIPKSNVAKLEYLKISLGEMTPVFNPKTLEYQVVVKDTINKLTIEAKCSDNCYSINGNQNQLYRESHLLVTGENEPIKINILAEDRETPQIYTIIVFRGEKTEEKADLKSLTIEGFELDPEFNSQTYNYYLDVPSMTEKLDIKYELFDETSIVTITGNENFAEDKENVVKINVVTKDGKLEHNYIINVNKVKDKVSSSEIINIDEENDVKDKPKKNNLLLIILIVIISLTIIGVAFYLIFKKKKKDSPTEVDVEELKDTVTISHEDDAELLEYTKEYTDLLDTIKEEEKPKRIDSDDYGKL